MKHVQLYDLVGKVKTLCPYHEERTPSMMVDFNKGTFHCFGCGKDGKINGVAIFKEEGEQ